MIGLLYEHCVGREGQTRSLAPGRKELNPVLSMGGLVAPACYYCRRIRAHASGYRPRPARHAVGSAWPRCDWHWRFECGMCGLPRHFQGTAYCPRERRYFCVDCSPEQRVRRRTFWGWAYYFCLRCPWRSEAHACLDRLEYAGEHPWQTDPDSCRTKRGMSRTRDIDERWSFRIEPIANVTERISRESWDASTGWWTGRYSPRGDVNREWVIDPALFRMLGDVEGLHVLDAGSGTGYLARLLSERGAKVSAVDHSLNLLAVARERESLDPRGVEYSEGDLARLPQFGDETFDVVVSNVVMQDVVRFREAFRELYRVLRPGGHFVFSVTHPCFERPLPGRWVREPPDSDRVEEWKGLLVDRYYDRVAIWWGPARKPQAVGFHRTLEDYSSALRDAGFLIARIEEPTPSTEALERKHREFADYLRVPLFLIMDAVRAPTLPQ